MTEDLRILISISEQSLSLLQGDDVLENYAISTAANGAGERMNSECTPRGEHVISEKIGAGCVENAVFVGREPTGEIFSPELRQQHPERDWILTRILWLSGCEDGRNKGGNVDSHARYIYLHGTPDDVEMGKPGSRGCVRVPNKKLIQLFDRVDVGTAVTIVE